MSSATASWCRPIRVHLRRVRGKIGMVFQHFNLFPASHDRAEELHGGAGDGARHARRARPRSVAAGLLDMVVSPTRRATIRASSRAASCSSRSLRRRDEARWPIGVRLNARLLRKILTRHGARRADIQAADARSRISLTMRSERSRESSSGARLDLSESAARVANRRSYGVRARRAGSCRAARSSGCRRCRGARRALDLAADWKKATRSANSLRSPSVPPSACQIMLPPPACE